VQRISKYGDIQITSFTPDKQLNIVIYRTPFCLIIYRRINFKKMVQYLAHPACCANQYRLATWIEPYMCNRCHGWL